VFHFRAIQFRIYCYHVTPRVANNKTLQYHASVALSRIPRYYAEGKKEGKRKKHQRGKKSKKRGTLSRTQRNPFTGFLGSRRELCAAFPAERLSTRPRKGESVESAKRESGNREGLKTRALCSARSRRAPSRKIEGQTVALQAQPFICLASRCTRAFFPIFDAFHPKFSAGAFPLLLSLSLSPLSLSPLLSTRAADLHNILEILYKISPVPLAALGLARELALCRGPRTPFRHPDARWVRARAPIA
jgi:hypothetical protein